MRATQILLLVLVWFLGVYVPSTLCANVTYDHRALVIDGKRRVLVSGSIHYPRSTPEVPLSLFPCQCTLIVHFVLASLNLTMVAFCYCRCGQTLFRNPKMVDLMWLRPMFSGTCTNQFEARFWSIPLPFHFHIVLSALHRLLHCIVSFHFSNLLSMVPKKKSLQLFTSHK